MRYFFEKHWNVHTVTVSTVTFHVHTVTLMCNGLDIFKFICSNMYFLEDLYCSFCFQLIAYKSFDIQCKTNDSVACILSVFPSNTNFVRPTKFSLVFL